MAKAKMIWHSMVWIRIDDKRSIRTTDTSFQCCIIPMADDDPSMNLQPRRDRRLRIGLVTVSCLYTFTFVGAFFGWGPMQLLVRIQIRCVFVIFKIYSEIPLITLLLCSLKKMDCFIINATITTNPKPMLTKSVRHKRRHFWMSILWHNSRNSWVHFWVGFWMYTKWKLDFISWRYVYWRVPSLWLWQWMDGTIYYIWLLFYWHFIHGWVVF